MASFKADPMGVWGDTSEGVRAALRSETETETETECGPRVETGTSFGGVMADAAEPLPSLDDLCQSGALSGCADVDDTPDSTYAANREDQAAVAVAKWTLRAAKTETRETEARDEDNDLAPAMIASLLM